MNDPRIKLTKRVENRWSPMEDDILFAEVLKAGHTICWRKVAAALPGRTNKSCRKRWIHSLDPNLRKGRWSASEDAALISAVNMHGKHWYQVARTLNNGRTDDQCAKRWREALDPTIRKDGWTEQEDELLVQAFRRVGRKWNEIAAALNGRPPVQCRNRWLSLARAGRFDDMPIKEESMSHNVGSPYELAMGGYDSESVTISRRPSTSSFSTCSSMSFMPSTPVFAPSPVLPHTSYLPPNLQLQMGEWRPGSSPRYQSDVMSQPFAHCPPVYEHGLRSCAWEEEEASSFTGYDTASGSQHLLDHYHHQHLERLELGYPEHGLASPSPLSLLCDTSVAMADMNTRSMTSPPLSATSTISSSSSAFSGISTLPSPTIPTGESLVGNVETPFYGAEHNQDSDTDPIPHMYTNNDTQGAGVLNNSFIMTCPIPSCSYYTQSLWDMWRHITWKHLSARRNSSSGGKDSHEHCDDGEVERMVERLVLRDCML